MTPTAGSARIATRARFYLFGTEVSACAGCYGPPHVQHDRAYLYRYQLAAGAVSPPVCGQACVVPALHRLARRPLPLPALAQRLLRRDRADFAAAKREQADLARAARMAALRALGDHAVARHMAEVILLRVTGQEACERRHLFEAGFTEDEVARLGAAAKHRVAEHYPDLRG